MSGYGWWVFWVVLIGIAAAVLHFKFPTGSKGRRRLKWSFWGLVILFVSAFLHYTLPQHDIIRVTDTYNRITTIGSNWLFYAAPDVGTAETGETRDVRFIEAVRPNGKVIVYRNEDTGWVWPPYFKYDSSNLQAEASNLKSTSAAPEWAVMTHYGWRLPFLSIYPNAISIKAVAGPDVRIIPWVNIVVLTALAILLFTAWRMLAQFRERSIDPLLEDIDEASDAAVERASGFMSRVLGWFRSWGRSSRR